MFLVLAHKPVQDHQVPLHFILGRLYFAPSSSSVVGPVPGEHPLPNVSNSLTLLKINKVRVEKSSNLKIIFNNFILI